MGGSDDVFFCRQYHGGAGIGKLVCGTVTTTLAAPRRGSKGLLRPARPDWRFRSEDRLDLMGPYMARAMLEASLDQWFLQGRRKVGSARDEMLTARPGSRIVFAAQLS